MIDTKIIFTSVLVVSLYISTVKANCESVTIESRQTLDFGLLRLLPDSSRGSAILWEDGGYYLSPGISLSSRSRPTNGQFSVTAPAGSNVLIQVTSIDLNPQKSSSHFTLSDIKVSKSKPLDEQSNRLYLVEMPDVRNQERIRETVNVGGTLLIHDAPKESFSIRYGLQVQCIDVR
jgi:hypothetical protein